MDTIQRGKVGMDYLFNPKSIAVAGVSASDAGWSMGRKYIQALLSSNFRGRVYPLNTKGGEVYNLKIHTKVTEISDEIDFVISCIPAHLTPQLMKECAAKGVKVVHLFTSGFGESGTEEGKRLEAELCNISQQSGVRLLGPNCMGVYHPKIGLSYAANFPAESGSVAFISQSGAYTNYFIWAGAQRGLRYSKVVSYGNAYDIDESDLLEYLTDDPETKIIGVYIEGIKDGRRFYGVLKEAAMVKPVIVLKGGSTEVGAQAASSHTGSLAGSTQVWEGLLEQAGVPCVHDLDELIDAMVTFLFLPKPIGRRIGSIAIGGGPTVVATDKYTSARLILPQLPTEMQEQLRRFIGTNVGVNLSNPLDIPMKFPHSGLYPGSGLYDTFKTLALYEGIDAVVLHLFVGVSIFAPSIPEEILNPVLDTMIKVHKEIKTPIAVVIDSIRTSEGWQAAFNFQRTCSGAKIPVYYSADSAARAINNFIKSYENQKNMHFH